MLADTLFIKLYQFISSELQYLIIFTLLIEKEKLISHANGLFHGNSLYHISIMQSNSLNTSIHYCQSDYTV